MGGLTDSIRRWYRDLPPVTGVLMLALAASFIAFFVLRLASRDLSDTLWSWLALDPVAAWRRPWTLLTMQVLHGDAFPVLFNVLALTSLVRWVERSLGRPRFLWLLLACALSGGLLFVAIGWPAGMAPTFGASGTVLGVLTAFALLHPEAQLRFWFAAPLKAKNLVWLILGIDAILVASTRGADMVPLHLGGMLAAWVYLRRPWTRAYRLRVASWYRRLRGRR